MTARDAANSTLTRGLTSLRTAMIPVISVETTMANPAVSVAASSMVSPACGAIDVIPDAIPVVTRVVVVVAEHKLVIQAVAVATAAVAVPILDAVLSQHADVIAVAIPAVAGLSR